MLGRSEFDVNLRDRESMGQEDRARFPGTAVATTTGIDQALTGNTEAVAVAV